MDPHLLNDMGMGENYQKDKFIGSPGLEIDPEEASINVDNSKKGKKKGWCNIL